MARPRLIAIAICFAVVSAALAATASARSFQQPGVISGWATDAAEPGLMRVGMAATPVRLVGAPSVRYTWVERGGDRFASFAAVVKLNRALTRGEQRRGRSTLVIAPKLRRGQQLPDELFGGGSLGRIGDRGHCYSAEPSQLPSRPTPRPGARWRLGIAANERVLGQAKRVTLRIARRGPGWQRETARRLGCMA